MSVFRLLALMNLKADQQVQIIIYRIIQELLNNIMKHAAAKSAISSTDLTQDGRLNITVEDDGKGFDPKDIDTSKKAWASAI